MSSLFLARLCWLAGCTNMAMHQMINLTYKNYTFDDPEAPLRQDTPNDIIIAQKIGGNETQRRSLVDRAIFHQKLNSIALCLLGLTIKGESLVPNTKLR